MFVLLWLKPMATGKSEHRMLIRPMHQVGEAVEVISVRPRHFRLMIIYLQKEAGLTGATHQQSTADNIEKQLKQWLVNNPPRQANQGQGLVLIGPCCLRAVDAIVLASENTTKHKLRQYERPVELPENRKVQFDWSHPRSTAPASPRRTPALAPGSRPFTSRP